MNALRSAFDNRRSQPRSPASQARPQVVYSNGWREYGAIDGYVDISISWDDQTGVFTGGFSFSGYDNGVGVAISGLVGFSGTTSIYYTPQPMPGDILDMTISFSSFTSTDGIDTVRVGGTMAFHFNAPTGGPVIATLNLVTRDEGTGKTVWIKDYTVTVTEGTDPFLRTYSDVTISGRIYLHVYGYVDLDTDTPFRTYTDGYPPDLYPSSGVLVVTGSGGRKARLTALDNTRYQVEVDADADGSYEWSMTGLWM